METYQVDAGTALTPADFSRKGDTHLSRLQRFLDALGNGKNGVLDADYIIPSQLVLGWKTRFSLDGHGHRICLADGSPTGWGGSALLIVECTDFEIANLICDGNRAKRTPAENPAHVIEIDKCHRWRLRGVQAVNGTCDGFYIFAGSEGNGTGPGGTVTLADCPSDWNMEDCVALGNFRQGLTITEAQRGAIRGGRYGQTHGLWDSGNGPCAGLDLEPDHHPTWPSGRIAGIHIEGACFDGNQGPGIVVTNVDGVRDIRIIDCTFDRNAKAAIESTGYNVDIVRPKVRGWNQSDYTNRADAPPKRGAIDIGAGAGLTRIVDPEFHETQNGASTANPCIYVHGSAAANIAVSGIRTDGTASVICMANAPDVHVSRSVVDLNGATHNDAFTFLGDRAVFEEVTLLGTYGRAAFFSGKQPRIINNKLIVRVADKESHVVNASEAEAPEIRGNIVEFAKSATGLAFGIGRDAVIVDNKVVNGGRGTFSIRAPARRVSGNLEFEKR